MWGKKQKACSLVVIYSDSSQLGIQYKLYKTLDYWSRNMLNFDFIENGLAIVCLSIFVYTILRKIFLVFCTSFTDQISLSDCLYFNMRIAIVC